MNGLYKLAELDANLVEALSNRATELRRGATPANYEGLALGLTKRLANGLLQYLC